MHSPILLDETVVRGEYMDTSKLAREIKSLKEQVQSAQNVDFIIIYSEEDETLYTDRQLKHAHVIRIVAKED